MSDAANSVAPARGLTSAEVAERVRAGRTNAGGAPASRTVWQIVRANVFTFFNGLLAVLLVAVLVYGSWRDALFGFVLVFNMAIGIVQELRAKRTLDRLALVAAPKARVMRDGRVQEIAVEAVVLDDVLELSSGEQVVVDGEVREAAGMEIDESLLTGESKPVVKAPGDTVMSGSFCVAGTGAMRATAVGADAYARRIAAEAQRSKRVPSELRRTTDRILKTIAVLIVPVAALLIATGWSDSHGNLRALVPGVVAALVGMVPQGLVLLTSIAFAVSVVKLANRQALIEELPAVEVLARVDVVCLDKTGTLTEPGLEVAALETVGGAQESDVRTALACLAAIEPPDARNATAKALAAAYGEPATAATGAVPFSSRRKWSAAVCGGGAWVLGAPDVLLPDGDPTRTRADALASDGSRVVLVARVSALPGADAPPEGIAPAALVTLQESVRGDAADTLAYFRDQGVALKVISGDSPTTVAAVARRAGLEIAGDPVDAQKLPTDAAELAEFMDAHTVFGRVRPEQKRDMVAAMQSRGHVVAMTGDGVNDVLALKTADMGIAMGSGAAASRAVAELVLLDGRFSHLPDVLAEGRRVMANVERVANLFVTKTVYAVLLAVGVGVFAAAYPLLPRHFTLIDALTIGIPGFFLALAPAAPRYRPGLLGRVMRFTLVSGTVIAVAAGGVYAWALGAGVGEGVVAAARTAVVLTISLVGLWVLAELSRPLTRGRIALVAAMAALLALVFAVPFARDFLALPTSRVGSDLVLVAVTFASAVAIHLGARAAGWRPASCEQDAAR